MINSQDNEDKAMKMTRDKGGQEDQEVTDWVTLTTSDH